MIIDDDERKINEGIARFIGWPDGEAVKTGLFTRSNDMLAMAEAKLSTEQRMQYVYNLLDKLQILMDGPAAIWELVGYEAITANSHVRSRALYEVITEDD